MRKWIVSGLAGSALALVVAGGALANPITLIDGAQGGGLSIIYQDPGTNPFVEKIDWVAETNISNATPHRWTIKASGVGKVPNNPAISDCILHLAEADIASAEGKITTACTRDEVGRYEKLTIESEHFFDDRQNVENRSFKTSGEA